MVLVIAIVLALAFPFGEASQLLAQTRNRSGKRGRQTSTNPLGRGQQVIETGRQLYNPSCTVCHGLEGTVGERRPGPAAPRGVPRTRPHTPF